MTPPVSPAQVRLDLIARREIALIDLREEDAYARGHPLFAANMPLSRLEVEALQRLPRRDVRIVLYDDGEGLTPPAAARLRALGYGNLRDLEGGLQGWRQAGLEVFQDVNSASKAFGELVEARRHTPSLSATEAKILIESEPNLAVLDARRWDEYQTMSIPRGVSVPGAELVLQAGAAAPDPASIIIVNCAGRTRSIIGAQSLINACVPNRVFALRNGAIGWTLAGLELEHGRDLRPPVPSAAQKAQARAMARSVADRSGVRRLLADELAELVQDRTRTLYRFDVRAPEVFAAGHVPGFSNAPGGQLVQETDVFAPVRGARIVLADDLSARADMTASWLAQMGWDVLVLDGGFEAVVEIGARAVCRPPTPSVQGIDAHTLARRLGADEVVILDLAPSPTHRRGHVPGAWFAIRAQLAEALERLPRDREIVLTSPDGVLAALAAAEVEVICDRAPLVLEGGTAAWLAAGLPVEGGLTRPANPPVDVYRRPYEGVDHAATAKQAYLDWEAGLCAQLHRDGTHGFFVI